MKHIWQLELKDGSKITVGDPWLDHKGQPVHTVIKVGEKEETLAVTLFAIRYVPDIEIDVTDMEDEDDVPTVIQRVPAHYELLSYVPMPANQTGVAYVELDVIQAAEVRKERQRRSQKDIQAAIAQWISEADDENEIQDAAAKQNGKPATETQPTS